MDYEKRHQDLIFINVTPGVEQGLRALSDNLNIVTSQLELHSSLKSAFTKNLASKVIVSKIHI